MGVRIWQGILSVIALGCFFALEYMRGRSVPDLALVICSWAVLAAPVLLAITWVIKKQYVRTLALAVLVAAVRVTLEDTLSEFMRTAGWFLIGAVGLVLVVALVVRLGKSQSAKRRAAAKQAAAQQAATRPVSPQQTAVRGAEASPASAHTVAAQQGALAQTATRRAVPPVAQPAPASELIPEAAKLPPQPAASTPESAQADDTATTTCKKCGAEITDETATVCPQCGEPLA